MWEQKVAFKIALILLCSSQSMLWVAQGLSQDDSSMYAEFVTNVKIDESYNLHDPPEGRNTNVSVSIDIKDIPLIDDATEELLIQLEIGLEWMDKRLTNMSHGFRKGLTITRLPLHKIWHPEIYIDKIMRVYRSSILAETPLNTVEMLGNGRMSFSTLVTIRLGCKMNFHSYPVDTQQCPFEIFALQALRLGWGIGNLRLYRLDTPNHYVYFEADDDKLEDDTGRQRLFSALVIKRKLGYHLLQTYLPSSLFVTLSWLSILIPPDSVSDRLSLSTTLLLTLTALFTYVGYNTPKVSYIKALDIWMIVCVVSVLMILVENIIVQMFMKKLRESAEKSKERKARLKKMLTGINLPSKWKMGLQQSGSGDDPGAPPSKDKVTQRLGDGDSLLDITEKNDLKSFEELAQRIDNITFVAAPIIFGVFGISYGVFLHQLANFAGEED